MKKEVKEKWLNALRSGEYQQCKGALKRGENNFCCLGVLSDIYQKENPDLKWESHPNHPDVLTLSCQKNEISEGPFQLCEQVMKFAEIDESLTKNIFIKEFNSTLVQLNDINGKSFAEIADIIEKHL